MSAEVFANLAETTLGAGYTSGGSSITVASASGFPSTGVFRVRLGNAGKTIYRVDSVSGTTFTGGAEANDANATTGDTVVLVATKAVAERFVQSPESGAIDLISGAAGVDAYGPVWKIVRPDTLSWSWQNQGGASVVDANGISFLSIPSQTTNLRSRLISAPSTPYTITALLRARYTTTTADRQYAGLIFRRSSTSKLYTFALQNSGNIQALKYTNDTTFSAVGAINSALAFGTTLAANWIWLRVSDDGTNLGFSYSLDGINFSTPSTEASATFFTTGHPDQVGIFGNVDSSAAAFDVSFASFRQT